MMSKYKRYIRNGIICFLAYILMSFSFALFSEKGDVFPFFNGYWFVTTPHTVYDFGVWVKSINGAEVKPSYIDYKSSINIPVWKFALYGATQRYGEAITNKNQKEIDRHKEFFENSVFRKNKVAYEVHSREYDIIKFLKDGQVRHFEIVTEVKP